MKHIAIIGGGAAGMMAGATIVEKLRKSHSRQNFHITLFERNNELGTKVALTGGGRCNLTTGITDVAQLLSKYPRGAQFLQFALTQFGPAQIAEWFTRHGVALKQEQYHRMFPQSDRGRDVVDVFDKIFAQSPNVCVRYGATVTDIAQNAGNQFVVQFTTSKIKSKKEIFDIIVLTTGGNAYAHTGSQGDGYDFAQKLGHTITPLAPSLGSLLVREQWVKDLSGLSLPDVQLSACYSDFSYRPEILKQVQNDNIQVQNGNVSVQNDKCVSVTGDFLFAHFGITGPVTFALSAHLAYVKIDENNPLVVKIVVDRMRDMQSWDQLLREEFARNGKKYLRDVLARYMPQRFAQIVCGEALPDDDLAMRKVAEISKAQRWQIAQILGDGVSVTVIGRRAGGEFVTAGGVDTREVDAHTGQSQIVENLYFAGEILDIDAVTGGFNLTSCWATGHLVGDDIAQNLSF